MSDNGANGMASATISAAEAFEARLGRIEAIAARGRMTRRDLASLRAALDDGGPMTREEAAGLFQIEGAAAAKPAGWTDFFVEAVTDHIAWQTRPTGIINESQGEWLVVEADRAGTVGAVALLVNVLAEAHRVPLWFVAAVRARAARTMTAPASAALPARAAVA